MLQTRGLNRGSIINEVNTLVILFTDDWHQVVTSSFEHYVAPSATSQSIHYQGEELFGQALGINPFLTFKMTSGTFFMSRSPLLNFLKRSRNMMPHWRLMRIS